MHLSLRQDVGKWVLGRVPQTFRCYSLNETHKQHILLNAMLKYFLILDLQDNIYTLVPKATTRAGEADRRVGVCFIMTFLEVQNHKHIKIMHLITYIDYGLRYYIKSKYLRTCLENQLSNILP